MTMFSGSATKACGSEGNANRMSCLSVGGARSFCDVIRVSETRPKCEIYSVHIVRATCSHHEADRVAKSLLGQCGLYFGRTVRRIRHAVGFSSRRPALAECRD